MSGQRSADDAGDNLGNDGSEPNNNHNNHRPYGIGPHEPVPESEHHHHHNHHHTRRRQDSTASGMAGGCSMREGADSIELRTGDGSSRSSSSATTTAGLQSRSYHPSSHHHPAGAATTSNDGLAVFTWGRGEDGQLGLGDTADQDEPTYVSFFLFVIILVSK